MADKRLKTEEGRKEYNAERDAYHARRRAAVLELLGGVCVQCGFSDKRALQIDHIHGGGKEERRQKSWHEIYNGILAKGDQGIYQLLCANCNQIKRVVNREHVGKRVYRRV